MKVRYSDEKYLCKYDLSIELFENLGVEIIELWPTRNVYILNTNKGKKILKIIDYNEERLNFICDFLDYIEKFCKNILKISFLNNGKRFLEWKGKKYVLLDLIEGTELNVANPVELIKTSEGIAKMHKVSQSFIPTLNDEKKYKNSELFNLKKYFEESIENLNLFKLQVNRYKYKNKFDELFLQKVDNNIKEINECIELLEKSNYVDICKKNEFIAICHNDLAYHNIIFNNNEPNFIDFDFCKIDIKIKDIADFILKCIKRFGFSLEIYDNIINSYSNINVITESEKEIL
ncbi:MAG: CotS family spore coat protein, partial [Sarcina sp.]